MEKQIIAMFSFGNKIAKCKATDVSCRLVVVSNEVEPCIKTEQTINILHLQQCIWSYNCSWSTQKNIQGKAIKSFSFYSKYHYSHQPESANLFSTFMASIAPKTPTTPSYFPEYGIASIWEPVATGARSGS